MPRYTLDDIKEFVDYLAVKIQATFDSLPTYGQTIDGAHPHLEVDKLGKLHYIIVERGKELQRKTTENIDDLLYWIFADVTFGIACEFELNHRIETQDFRRIMFKKQEELLGILNELWKVKKEEEHKKILKLHPFDDEN